MQMVQGRGPHNQNHFVWTAAGQQGGSGRGGARSLENEFPTFGETARGELFHLHSFDMQSGKLKSVRCFS